MDQHNSTRALLQKQAALIQEEREVIRRILQLPEHSVQEGMSGYPPFIQQRVSLADSHHPTGAWGCTVHSNDQQDMKRTKSSAKGTSADPVELQSDDEQHANPSFEADDRHSSQSPVVAPLPMPNGLPAPTRRFISKQSPSGEPHDESQQCGESFCRSGRTSSPFAVSTTVAEPKTRIERPEQPMPSEQDVSLATAENIGAAAAQHLKGHLAMGEFEDDSASNEANANRSGPLVAAEGAATAGGLLKQILRAPGLDFDIDTGTKAKDWPHHARFPTLIRIPRDRGSGWAELRCNLCGGNHSHKVFSGFWRGIPGLRRHILSAHAEQFDKMRNDTVGYILAMCIVKVLTHEEVSDMEYRVKGVYTIPKIRPAEASESSGVKKPRERRKRKHLGNQRPASAKNGANFDISRDKRSVKRESNLLP